MTGNTLTPETTGGSLVLSRVTKVYPGKRHVAALRSIDLTIGDGEAAAIMGPSGSGKSTLLNLMGGLDVPTSGSIVVAGLDLDGLSEDARSRFRRAHVAYIFQAYHLMATLTAAQNIALPLHLQGVPRRQINARVEEVLENVGLRERARHLPEELSGGECQRVAIARALVTNPRILLADEPTGNLDSQTGAEILDLLQRLHRGRAATLVLVTHDHHIAASCDRIIRLRDGQIEAAAGS